MKACMTRSPMPKRPTLTCNLHHFAHVFNVFFCVLSGLREKQPGRIDRYKVKWHGRSAWAKHNVIIWRLAVIYEYDLWMWDNEHSRFLVASPFLSPNGMVPPIPPKNIPCACYCSISESRPPICMLFAAFQSHKLPLATFLQHFRAMYFLQNSSVLLIYYLHAVYILPIYIYHHLSMYVFSILFHLYTTNSVSIHYPYVILLYHVYILPIACLYATYIPLMARLFLAYIVQSMTDKLHQLPHPPTPHATGVGATTYTA